MPWLLNYLCLTRKQLFYVFLIIIGIYIFNLFIAFQLLESQTSNDGEILHKHLVSFTESLKFPDLVENSEVHIKERISV